MPTLSVSLKLQLYNTSVLPTAIYASETWKNTSIIAKKLNTFNQRCLRRILGVTYRDHITNEEILRRSGAKRLQDIVTERRVRLAGHVLRLPDHRHSKIALRWTPPEGKRKRGRPKKTWRSTMRNDLKEIGISWEEAEEIAANRQQWRKLAAQCSSR